MKLLIATGLFYPSTLGGPANTLYWLAKALVKAGIDVTVITSSNHINDDSVPFDRWTYINGIKIQYCTKSSSSKTQINLAKRELKNCDVLMLSSVCTRDNLFIGLSAKRLNKKIIWSPRGEFFDSAISVGSRYKPVYFKLLKLFFAKYATFHATSEDEKQTIFTWMGKDTKVRVLPNYIEVPDLQKRNKSQPPYLVYVGRIAPIKALDNLLEGLAQSERFMKSDYILKIVGGVEDKFNNFYDRLLSMRELLGLQDKVEFVGPKSGTEKFQLYADAKFSLLVSKSENFGNVVIEALSQGTPVISSQGTPWQILDERNAGYWIDNSPQSIKKCIDEALTIDGNTYNSMRTNALKLVKEYDVSKNVQKWVDILEGKML